MTQFNTLHRFEIYLRLREEANGMKLEGVDSEVCEY